MPGIRAGIARGMTALGLVTLVGVAGPSPFLATARQAQPAPVPAPTIADAPIPVLQATVVARYPHDVNAFTQGLIWRDAALYESVGREGRSEIRRVDLATGRVLQRAVIPADQFGEGLAEMGRELVSLTWRDGVAHRWDARTLKRRGAFRYSGEGWGLASDGRRFVLSDGSAELRFMDPRRFAELGRVTVTLRGRPVREANELEFVGGALLANVWHTPYLLQIDPATGKVTGLVDLRPIVREVGATDPEAVLNGIAWDAKGRRLFVTGKLWPTVFEIRVPGLTDPG